MERVCKLGVVLRKSGLNEFRLTNQSFVFAWVMREPDNETKLKSSCESSDCESAHWLRVPTTFVNRWTAFPSRTARAGPGSTATTNCTGVVDSVNVSSARGW